jgi:hypothetical protein
MKLNDSLLKRFWFKIEKGHGIGVTAYTIDDAIALIAKESLLINTQIVEIIEDVDIQSLDQNHVIPNMGPPNFRGIWFPNLML